MSNGIFHYQNYTILPVFVLTDSFRIDAFIEKNGAKNQIFAQVHMDLSLKHRIRYINDC